MDNPILRIAMQGQRALEEGRLPAALAAADQLVSENPHQSRFRWFRANVLYEMASFADAGSEARTVVSLEPDFYPAHFMLAVCADQLNRRSEAQEHFEIALRLSRRNPDVLEEYALFMASQRGPRVGEKVARSAIGELPDSSAAWTALGVAQLRLHEYAQAESAFQRALELDTGYGAAQYMLARLYAQTGRENTARALNDLMEENELQDRLREELDNPHLRRPLAGAFSTNPSDWSARPMQRTSPAGGLPRWVVAVILAALGLITLLLQLVFWF